MLFRYARSDQPKGNFFYKHSVLAMETRYLGLREWENKKHHASASSVGKQEKNMHSSFNFNDVLY